MAKLTIRDIARLSGLSKSTVSLVLNDSPRVDPATRRRVLAVMERHNYVPSFAATARRIRDLPPREFSFS